MMKIVFLLEEPSMKEALNGILPRVIPDEIPWQCIPHEGKTDLERSIPRKLRAWREPGVRFVVIRDQDRGNCVKIKQRLKDFCQEGGRTDTLVRIACRELESWFLGDLAAADAANLGRGNLKKQQEKAKFSNPDELQNPAGEIAKLIPGYRKIGGARAIGPHLSLEGNRSHSFGVFLKGIRCLLNGLDNFTNSFGC